MNKNKNDIFANNLSYYLRKFGYAQNTFADAMNVSEATVSEWMNGKKFPRINRLEQMTEIFNCHKSDLIDSPYERDVLDGRISKCFQNIDQMLRNLDEKDKLLLLRLIEGAEVVAERLKDEKES